MARKKKGKFYDINKKAEKAMNQAFKNVIEEYKKSGVPLALWKNGKVVSVPASEF